MDTQLEGKVRKRDVEMRGRTDSRGQRGRSGGGVEKEGEEEN